MSVGDSDQESLDLYRRLVVENYCITASSALLFFDHVITLGDEVQRIWQREFTGATLVYLVTRWSATFERICLVVSLFLATTDDKVHDSLTDLNTLIIGVFAALRIYAIFGRDWRPSAPFILLAISTTVINMYFQINYTPIAFGPPLWGCGASFHVSDTLYDRLNTSVNALVLTSDVLLLVLTWAKTAEIRRASVAAGMKAPLATLIIRDGTLYFVVILVIQIFAIVSQQIGSNFVLFQVWTYWNQSVTVIALCRFMLNLRGVYLSRTRSPSQLSSAARHSDMRLVSQVVGNFGAPLDGLDPTSPDLGLDDEYEYAADVDGETPDTLGAETPLDGERGEVAMGGIARRGGRDGEPVVVSHDPLSAGLLDRPVDSYELHCTQV